MGTQDPPTIARLRQSAANGLVWGTLTTRLSELGADSDETIQDTLGERSGYVGTALFLLVAGDPLTIANKTIARLRGSDTGGGVFGFLEDAANAAELLAKHLDQKPFTESRLIPQTEEGTVRNCGEELRTAIETLTFWRDTFAGEERYARQVRTIFGGLSGPPAADIALFVEYVAHMSSPECKQAKVKRWANKLARAAYEAVTGSPISSKSLRELKSRERTEIRQGKPSRVIGAAQLAGFTDFGFFRESHRTR